MSQLDYLWTTYGGLSVSDEVQKDSSIFIPTQQLMLELIKQTSNSAVGSVALKDKFLVLYSTDGFEISRVDISELTSNNTSVQDFGSKFVTQKDIDKGCPFELNTRVYYITLSNGSQFFAKQLSGSETSTISTKVVDDQIVSTLKLDSKQDNVVLSTDNGLKATLPFKNLGVPIQFTYITQEEYSKTDYKLGTIYFIKDKSYLYLNGTKIGSVTEIIEVVDQLPVIGEDGKIYLLRLGTDDYCAYTYVNGVAVALGGKGDAALSALTGRVAEIENTLTWKEY